MSWGKPTPADEKNVSLKILEFCRLGQFVAVYFLLLDRNWRNECYFYACVFFSIATQIGLKFPVVILSSSKLFLSQKRN